MRVRVCVYMCVGYTYNGVLLCVYMPCTYSTVERGDTRDTRDTRANENRNETYGRMDRHRSIYLSDPPDDVSIEAMRNCIPVTLRRKR